MSHLGGVLVRVVILALVVSVSTTTTPDPAGAAEVVPLPLIDAVASEGAELVVDLSADDWGPASGTTVTWSVRVENRSLAASAANDPEISVGTASGMSALGIVEGSLPAGWVIAWEDPDGTQVSIVSADPIAVGGAVEFAVTAVATGAVGAEAEIRASARASNQWWETPRPGHSVGRTVVIDGTHLSGTIVDEGGTPLRDVCIDVSDHENGGWWSTTTRSDGAWDLSVPSDRTVDVRFRPSCQANYRSGYATAYGTQWWPGVSSPAAAETVTTNADRNLGEIVLGAGGAIGGTVSTPDGVDPTGVSVSIELPDSGWWVDGIDPAADGTWMMHGLPVGSYVVRYQGPGIAEQYHDGVGSRTDATLVEVNAGSATTGIDATLVAPSRIAGTVTDAGTGEPIEDADVSVRTPEGDWAAHTTTESDGTYEIDWLAAGEYVVQFSVGGGSYAPVFHDGSWLFADAVPMTLAAAAELEVDITMSPGVQVSGRVVADGAGNGLAAGDPIADVAVVAWLGGLDFDSEPVAYAVTAEDGTYTLAGLPPSDVALAFVHRLEDSDDGALDPDWGVEFWPGVSSPLGAGVLDLSGAAASVTGIDARLTPISTVSGRVIDAQSGTLAASTGLEGMAVALFLPFDNQPFTVTQTDADGGFELKVPFADYDFHLGAVDIEGVHGGVYPPLWFGGNPIDVSDFDDIDPAADGAASLQVPPGTDRTDIFIVHNPPPPPSPPASVRLEPGDGSLTVSWNTPAEPVDEYTIMVDGSEVAAVPADSSGSGLELSAAMQHRIDGLTNGRGYEITVGARNLSATTLSAAIAGTPGEPAEVPPPDDAAGVVTDEPDAATADADGETSPTDDESSPPERVVLAVTGRSISTLLALAIALTSLGGILVLTAALGPTVRLRALRTRR